MSGPSLAQKVTNIKHMPVLLAATSATKEPADGYLVKDIIKMSFESHQTRLFLQQYLVNQLITSNNVFSKIKILRLFLVLLEEGHIEFKQNLRRSPEPFNEAAKLRPHQPKDQKLVAECGRIRDMADKILDVLYSDVPEMRKNFSSNVPDESSSSSGGGGSRIMGFGNTGPNTGNDSSGSSKPSTTDKLKALFGTTGKSPVVYDPSYATMDPVPHNTSANSPFTVHIPSGAASSGSYQGNQAKPSGAPHERGQAGGGWGTSDDQSRSNSYKPVTSQWSSSNYREQQAAAGNVEEEDQREHLSSTGEDLSSYEQGSIEQEQRLVDDITAPGGVRAAPPRETLNAFITRCKVLDALSVVECLRLKLLSDESQTVLRALFVIEALLRSDIPDILSHLDIVLQDLSDLSSSPNSSVQAKSKKILVQLTSVNVTRVPDVARSNQQLSREEEAEKEEGREEEEEEEGTDEGQNSGISSIFSGLSVSGEKTTRSSAPKKRRKKVSGKKQASPSVRRQQPNGEAKPKEEKSGFADILGLGELTSSDTVEPSAQQLSSQQQVPAAEEMQHQQLMMYEEVEEQDDSLLTFEEDVEFDPLKRSDSVTRGLAKSGSLSKKPAKSASLEQNSSISDSNPPHPPLTSQESLGHIQDLTGIDLTAASKASDSAQIPQQDNQVLYPLQMTSIPAPSMAMPTTMNVMVTSSAGIMPHPSHPQGAAGIQLVSVPPAAVGQGHLPLTMQAGGMGYGGGAPAMVPVMYTSPQGAPGMMYQPQFGGVARPVQRAAEAKELTPPPDTGFSFISKSNKNNAFAFVQDEMNATKTKK